MVSLNQACPATPFVADLPGRDGRVRQVRRGLLQRRGHPDPRRRPDRRPAVPAPTRSPPAAAAWTRTSARRTPRLQAPGSPGPAASTSADGRRADRRAHHRPGPRLPRRAGGERPGAEPRRCDRAATRTRLSDGGEPTEEVSHGGTRTAAGLPRAPPRASARPTRCSRRATAGASAAPTWWSASSRPTAARTPRPCWPAWRWCRAARSPTAAPTFTEMDLDAVLARRPEVVLVDELAHTNVPGSPQRQALAGHRGAARRRHHRHHHRQHPAPGVAQRRRRSRSPACRSARPCPTRWSAGAEQIELVDMTPEALRRRMAHGNIYRAGEGRRRAGQLLPGRQPHRAARAGPAVAGRQGRRPARPVPRRARHRRHLGGPRTGRRRAHRRPRGRHPDPPGGPDRRPHQGRRPARRPRRPQRRPRRRRPGATWPGSGSWSRASAAPTTRSSATTSRPRCSTSPAASTPPSSCSAPAGAAGSPSCSPAASASPPPPSPARSTSTWSPTSRSTAAAARPRLDAAR